MIKVVAIILVAVLLYFSIKYVLDIAKGKGQK